MGKREDRRDKRQEAIDNTVKQFISIDQLAYTINQSINQSTNQPTQQSAHPSIKSSQIKSSQVKSSPREREQEEQEQSREEKRGVICLIDRTLSLRPVLRRFTLTRLLRPL
ncbi:hypothetical protein DID88_002882 [Monilinia fructigena]|uniref:Uncharacterized protein n=1 Tax=Monilinia fructigena TaxID=38457 RepID=A0A395ITZ1_9HELO|nr:hypothetical protein DID88_002882 [Monilinia fructigena]